MFVEYLVRFSDSSTVCGVTTDCQNNTNDFRKHRLFSSLPFTTISFNYSCFNPLVSFLENECVLMFVNRFKRGVYLFVLGTNGSLTNMIET